MAKDIEKKDTKATKDTKDTKAVAKKPKKESKFHPIRYIKEMWGEVKKLTWLSGKELLNHTLVVFAFVIAMALIIYVLDIAFSTGMNALSGIKIG